MNDQQMMLNQAAAEKPLTVAEMVSQVTIIQQMLTTVMKDKTHYGVIPGTPAPTLYKAGAEKIMATFRLAADPQVEDLGTDVMPRFRVIVEEKYCWRLAVCQEEFDEAPVDRRREKWRKGWGNKPPSKIQQVRTNPADLANTILKMAKKRALVDAVLTATAASDVFAQDLEDLPQEYVASEVVQEAPRAARQASPAPRGVAQTQGSNDADTKDLMESLTEVAQQGWPALQKEWGKLSGLQRAAVGSAFGQLKDIAAKADAAGGDA